MIDHVSSYTTQYPMSRAFYDAVLGELGVEIQTESVMEADENFPNRRICAWGPPGKGVFWIIEVKRAIDPRHLAFAAPNRSSVDRFHAAGLAAGGVDHGAPGLRPIYHANYYGAFLLDPDGNNVEAVCHLPS